MIDYEHVYAAAFAKAYLDYLRPYLGLDPSVDNIRDAEATKYSVAMATRAANSYMESDPSAAVQFVRESEAYSDLERENRKLASENAHMQGQITHSVNEIERLVGERDTLAAANAHLRQEQARLEAVILNSEKP